MRTTKDDWRQIGRLVEETETRFGRGSNVCVKGKTLLALCDDAEDAKTAADALESLALAAGLPATATPAEVVARVGEMRSVLVRQWQGLPGSGDDANRLAARLASEAGR